jgi:hypothetical protein
VGIIRNCGNYQELWELLGISRNCGNYQELWELSGIMGIVWYPQLQELWELWEYMTQELSEQNRDPSGDYVCSISGGFISPIPQKHHRFYFGGLEMAYILIACF